MSAPARSSGSSMPCRCPPWRVMPRSPAGAISAGARGQRRVGAHVAARPTLPTLRIQGLRETPALGSANSGTPALGRMGVEPCQAAPGCVPPAPEADGALPRPAAATPAAKPTAKPALAPCSADRPGRGLRGRRLGSRRLHCWCQWASERLRTRLWLHPNSRSARVFSWLRCRPTGCGNHPNRSLSGAGGGDAAGYEVTQPHQRGCAQARRPRGSSS
jgi:hypothetical protein